MIRKLLAATAAIVVTHGASAALAQTPPDTGPRIAAQAEAMKKLAFMDGVWRGPAWTIMPGGKHEVTQAERIGPLLGGSVKVVEGRGYNADGTTGFNALGIIAFEPETGAYSMRSYAMGHAGDFKLTPTADGFIWEVPAGPMTMRYTAVVKDGAWREVGERIMDGRPPVQFFEMNLKRVGDSAWPTAGAIPPK
ncbi:DUF1579 domain-containing protein [Caulobacter sp. 1776]|uniref:DUF1579 domain-containing protein n=1 Tax=Caulobacter sp. 1776 TaxID=3156420 RepID=UPI003392BF5D